MTHKIITEASSLAESLKSAQNYIKKDANPDDCLGHVILTYMPKAKKLAVITCDGHGYFERRLPVISDKKTKPSLPGKNQTICLSASDAQALGKLMPAKMFGSVILEITEDNPVSFKANLPNGSTAMFGAKVDLEIPDFSAIRAKAEKGKKMPANLNNVNVPVHEMLRAGKSLPAKSGAVAQMFTANGAMALLECLDDTTDIRIIFTFAGTAETAA